MFTKVLLACLVVAPQLALADIHTNCGIGYGPQPNNLTVLLDDEMPGRVDRIGFDVDGVFFELRLVGCSRLTVANGGTLVCERNSNSKEVGVVKASTLETEDTPYDGRRAIVVMPEQIYNITGSCRPQDNSPLTLSFPNL